MMSASFCARFFCALDPHPCPENGLHDHRRCNQTQPALLQGISNVIGPGPRDGPEPEEYRPDVCGVTILHGEKDLEQVAAWTDTAFITGSTLVNGSIDRLLNAFHGKRIVFFGTTIAIPASLMGWERWCFESA